MFRLPHLSGSALEAEDDWGTEKLEEEDVEAKAVGLMPLFEEGAL